MSISIEEKPMSDDNPLLSIAEDGCHPDCPRLHGGWLIAMLLMVIIITALGLNQCSLEADKTDSFHPVPEPAHVTQLARR